MKSLKESILNQLEESILSTNNASAWAKPIIDEIVKEVVKLLKSRYLRRYEYVVDFVDVKEMEKTIRNNLKFLHEQSPRSYWVENDICIDFCKFKERDQDAYDRVTDFVYKYLDHITKIKLKDGWAEIGINIVPYIEFQSKILLYINIEYSPKSSD